MICIHTTNASTIIAVKGEPLTDFPIVQWLRDTFLPMLVNESAEYPKPDEDEASNEALLHEPESLKSILPCAPPPPQKAVLFCPLPGQCRHLTWWLTKFFADNLDIFYMIAEIGNDERTEMLYHIRLCYRHMIH